MCDCTEKLLARRNSAGEWMLPWSVMLTERAQSCVGGQANSMPLSWQRHIIRSGCHLDNLIAIRDWQDGMIHGD